VRRDPIAINKIFYRIAASLPQALLVHCDRALFLSVKGIHHQVFTSSAQITNGQN
jgi:hypothetical protein